MRGNFISANLSYLFMIVPVIIFSLLAQAGVKSAFKKYSKVNNKFGLTGEQAARRVLQHYGINDVCIVQIDGKLTDNYNSETKTISLSSDVYNGISVAAVGIACHEAGHAAQYAKGYTPIKIRNTFVKPANIGCQIAWPLAIAGYFLSFNLLIYIGIFLYLAVMLFQLVTLPVEFNASARALKVIKETEMLDKTEVSGARKVLSAAAMTYIAAFAMTTINLLRLILLSRRR